MNRLTKKTKGNKYYIIDNTKIQHDKNGYYGEAVDKLARLENIYDNLTARQAEIAKELERLRAEGKTNTVKFKQLLAEKITNNNILVLFEVHGA